MATGSRHFSTRRRGLPLIPGLLLAVAAAYLTSCAADSGGKTYILATATTGGTYYPVGVAIATLTKQVLEPEHGIALAAISSAGSEENLRLMRDREAKFSILQGLYGAWAWRAEGRLAGQAPFGELRSIAVLWPNVEHFIVRGRHVETGTIVDIENLAGRRFSIGARYSGAEGSTRHIFRALGIDPDRTFVLAYQGYGASADALQNQLIDGMNVPAGVPVGAATRALAAARGDAVLLQFTADQLAAINAEYEGLWDFFDLAPGTYPHQDEVVRTIAQPNFLAVTAEVPDEHVYLIVRTIYENLSFLHAFHAATRSMRIDNAIDGLPVPLHPGALRYYHERGLAIPDRLLPPEERD
jgi:uncharacterized protein